MRASGGPNEQSTRSIRSTVPLLAVSALTALLLLSCGAALFLPTVAESARFASSLSYEGQAFVGVGNQVDTSTLRFIPSRNYSIASAGVTGLLVNAGTFGANSYWVSEDPSQPNPATSQNRIASSLSGDSFGGGSTDPLQFSWDIDTIAVTGVAAGTDYYSRIEFPPHSYTLNTITLPAVSQSTATSVVAATSDLVSLAGSVYTGMQFVGGEIGFDTATGGTYIYALMRDSAGMYWPAKLAYAVAAPGTVAGPASAIGPAGSSFAIPDNPTNGRLLFDPTSGLCFFSYEYSGTIKTLEWDSSISGAPSPQPIPVDQLPKAVLPGGYLYAESGGVATVYRSSGVVAGSINIGALHLAHIAVDPSTGAPELIFSYLFPGVLNGSDVVYIRVYSIDLQPFLGILH